MKSRIDGLTLDTSVLTLSVFTSLPFLPFLLFFGGGGGSKLPNNNLVFVVDFMVFIAFLAFLFGGVKAAYQQIGCFTT